MSESDTGAVNVQAANSGPEENETDPVHPALLAIVEALARRQARLDYARQEGREE